MYNTCLQIESYDNLPEAYEVEQMAVGSSYFRYEHIHRKWEYGLVLKFMREFKPKSVLNVGGGNSPLSSLALATTPYVTEIDPMEPGHRIPEIAYIVDKFPSTGLTGKFDLVVSTSVIEHVEEDWYFFRALLNQASKYVFITTDFHPSGKAKSQAHYRTYNQDGLNDLIEIAYDEFGFRPEGEVNYTYKSPLVYDYTFAALALRKQE